MANPAAAPTAADRLPPQNLDAEAAALGSMLLDNQTIAEVAQLLRPADFYSHEHRVLFETILGLSDRGRPVDILILTDTLRDRGVLEDLGGPELLVSVMESVPSAANATHYAEIVRQAAIRRHLIEACRRVETSAHHLATTTDALLDKAQSEIFNVSMGSQLADASLVSEILDQVFKDIEQISGDRITGVRTHFDRLDDLTCGLQKSELIIIAGRPSMGKTTFALNLAGRVALGDYHRPDPADRRPVLIFSLEMSKPVIARNLLCGYAMVDAHKLRRGLLTHEETQGLITKAGDLYEAKLYVDDTPGLSLRDLRTRARRLKMDESDLALIIVDYLQLMEEPGAENRQQEISKLCRGLKGLARELEVPIVVLSQLSRAVESREDHVPRMSDLRESGSIEQDADLIIFLYREEQYHPGARPGEADLIISKQRNGPTGRITTTFLRQYLRFEDYAPEQPGI